MDGLYAMSYVIDQPFKYWTSTLKTFVRFQMVRLSGIQMAFKYRTIWHPTLFGCNPGGPNNSDGVLLQLFLTFCGAPDEALTSGSLHPMFHLTYKEKIRLYIKRSKLYEPF